MRIVQEELSVATRGKAAHDLTREVNAVVARAKATVGLCHVFVMHTSASLLIQENADPSVLRDLEAFLARLAPESDRYEHDAEGPDDMPAHLRAALTKTSETVPISGGRLALGTWQAIYLLEHRARPHTRRVVVTCTVA